MKTESIDPSLFDLSLTPLTAMKKGYTYIDDVIYDQRNPSEAIVDLLELVKKIHCKFGKPGNALPNSECYGLYVPKGAEMNL